ncbi:GNAT family N-acetyltransferase (plasmid) [Streptomyces olivoreticuli]|uniref:GNAT family N-acetyltransferase n=1 Tax=Streptomyces olivoreticuli TaxID=68246 RepID=UPI00265AC7CB|nr:GNAT family N-acetyltransferase [Streptomyces olivoreticuli]WKK27799.1 GNAT family N-acetyltransferase [Streptomyces olivoreticuli]
MRAIRPATAADIPALMALRTEAEAWLSAAGIDQWQDATTRQPALAKWENNIRDGRTWVIDNDDRTGLLATVTLAPPDRDFWRDADSPDSALYVAKLITARRAKGERLGGRILDWASSIARDRGLPWVRLDCWRDNTKLQGYYLRAGFRHVRTEAPAHRLSGWMAQRPASVVLHPGQGLATADTPVSVL